MTPSHQQMTKLLLLMTTLQASANHRTACGRGATHSHRATHGRRATYGCGFTRGHGATRLPMVKVKELLVVEVLHQEQMP